jgi:hypothetical protein
MVEEGLVREMDAPADSEAGGGRPRFYGITPAGRRILAHEVRRMQSFVEVARARRVLDGPDAT